MGTNLPKMGRTVRLPTRTRSKQANSLADALFSLTQQRVLSLVFGQPERAFAISELIRLVGSGSGAVQRELQRLVDSKLVV
jgi:DNA-binding MarR family transcriptional regulator